MIPEASGRRGASWPYWALVSITSGAIAVLTAFFADDLGLSRSWGVPISVTFGLVFVVTGLVAEIFYLSRRAKRRSGSSH